MKRTPRTRPRSKWTLLDASERHEIPYQRHLRNVNDGTLLAIVTDDPGVGWHMSVSHRDHNAQLRRYPTWDELAHAREELLPDDLLFVMRFPREEEFVNVHDTTFHLFEHPPRNGGSS